MDTEQLSDLAFDFVNSRVFLTPGLIVKCLKDNGGDLKDLDYFLVFIKHWLDNRRDLEWSEIILELSNENFSQSGLTK